MSYPTVPATPVGVISTPVTKIIPIKALAITAGTPVDVYTPTLGKSFNILTYHLGASAAAAVIFEDGSGGASAEILRTGTIGASSSNHVGMGALGAGVPSGTPNNHLFLDATASVTVNGWIGISEF